MDISTLSSLGASNVQAVNLVSLLNGSSSDTSNDALSTSLGSQADSLTLSSQGQWASRAQGANPFKTDFEALGKLIDSGDLAGAKKAFAAMTAKMQAHQKDDQNPLATDFAALGKALAGGDTAAATTAYQSMQTDLKSLEASQGASASGGANAFQTDLANLGKLLDAGDTTGAKAALDAMQTKMKAHGHGHHPKAGGTVATDFEALGKALDAGDNTAASSAFKTLQSDLAGAQASSGGNGSSSSSSSQSDLEGLLLAAYLKNNAALGSGASITSSATSAV
jgi:hypothetical protein